jgi:DNA-binding MarR family transcriptional regulator
VADRPALSDPDEKWTAPTVTSETEELEQGLTALVARAFFYTRRVFDEAMRPFGITASQAGVLNRIYEHPGISGAEISRQMGTTPQAVRLMLATLVRKGLVERRPDPDNGRIVQAFLSEQGRTVILSCRSEAVEIEGRLAKDVDDDERRMVIQFLERYLRGSGMPDTERTGGGGGSAACT